jgi:sigma-B regulation protein RsbU (phosphoserine phosphatase)
VPEAGAAIAAALLACLAAWTVTRRSLRTSLLTLAALVGATLALVTLLYGLAGRVAPAAMSLLVVPLSAAAAGLLRRRHDERVEAHVRRDLERAREIQRALLPAPLADRPDLDLALCFRPTEAIGGDLPDWFELEDGRLVLALGDVSGSGLPAAMRAQELRGLLRGHLDAGRALSELADWLNGRLRPTAPGGSFVSLWLAALVPDGRTLNWVNCGHEPALLVRRGTALWLLTTGDALGLFADAGFRQEEMTLQPGDLLLLFTDGVIDAGRPPHLYDMERLKEVALRAATPTASSATILREILGDLVRFNGGESFEDDVCLIALQLRRSQDAPRRD